MSLGVMTLHLGSSQWPLPTVCLPGRSWSLWTHLGSHAHGLAEWLCAAQVITARARLRKKADEAASHFSASHAEAMSEIARLKVSLVRVCVNMLSHASQCLSESSSS